MPQAPENIKEFSALVEVVNALRGPKGCPWDKEQSHSTLTQFAIEEAHELAEAIDLGQQQQIVEELGDLLLQVILHAEIARQENRFDIFDVIKAINEKMIRRHPHVFGSDSVNDSKEVLENWAKIKTKENPQKKLFDIPKSLPALLYSQKIGSITKKYGFDWEKPEQVVEKIKEELLETEEALQKNNHSDLQHEIGDLLFSVGQLARHCEIDAEQALRKTNQRFEKRYQTMQDIAVSRQLKWTELSSEQKEELWEEAKRCLS